jgi:predicted homoserine dehydrogenase-like protein
MQGVAKRIKCGSMKVRKEAEPMKVGVAGQGAFGVKHIEAIQNIPGIEIITLSGGNQAPPKKWPRSSAFRIGPAIWRRA